MSSKAILQHARDKLLADIAATQQVFAMLDYHFVNAVRILDKCRGRVVFTGVGKSGHVARKVASTFASLGKPAHFVHAAEASHGDLGMIARGDIVVAISNSGETKELAPLLDFCALFTIPVIAITSTITSTLAQKATAVLCHGVLKDVAFGAPMASTIASMAIGDALAACVTAQIGMTFNNFQEFHPAGSLGEAK